MRLGSIWSKPRAHSISTQDAAKALGVQRNQVRWLIHRGHLVACRGPKNELLVDPESVSRLIQQREGWISISQAATLAGVSRPTVVGAVKRGEIVQRKPSSGVPSVSRSSALAWGQIRRPHAEHRRVQRALRGRPDLEHEWLNQTQTGEVLGITRTRVAQLAQRGRLPFTAVGTRRWFRRDHVELVRNAREAARHHQLGFDTD